MPPHLPTASSSTSTMDRNTRFKQLWATFETWVASDRESTRLQTIKALADVDVSYDKLIPRRSRTGLTAEQQQQRTAEKRRVTQDLERARVFRARGEWQRRLAVKKLNPDLWELTDKERTAVENALGGLDEEEEDEEAESDGSSSPQYERFQPSTSSSHQDRQNLESGASDDDNDQDTPAYISWASSNMTAEQRLVADLAQFDKPDRTGSTTTITTTTSTSATTSATNHSSSHKTRVSGPSYVGPIITSTSSAPLISSSSSSSSTFASQKSEHAAAFERFKLSLRVAIIREFHALAADADVQLVEELSFGRDSLGWSKADELERIERHQAEMEELQREKERERKERQETERRRILDEIKKDEERAKIAQQQQHQQKQQQIVAQKKQQPPQTVRSKSSMETTKSPELSASSADSSPLSTAPSSSGSTSSSVNDAFAFWRPSPAPSQSHAELPDLFWKPEQRKDDDDEDGNNTWSKKNNNSNKLASMWSEDAPAASATPTPTSALSARFPHLSRQEDNVTPKPTPHNPYFTQQQQSQAPSKQPQVPSKQTQAQPKQTQMQPKLASSKSSQAPLKQPTAPPKSISTQSQPKKKKASNVTVEEVLDDENELAPQSSKERDNESTRRFAKSEAVLEERFDFSSLTTRPEKMTTPTASFSTLSSFSSQEESEWRARETESSPIEANWNDIGLGLHDTWTGGAVIPAPASGVSAEPGLFWQPSMSSRAEEESPYALSSDLPIPPQDDLGYEFLATMLEGASSSSSALGAMAGRGQRSVAPPIPASTQFVPPLSIGQDKSLSMGGWGIKATQSSSDVASWGFPPSLAPPNMKRGVSTGSGEDRAFADGAAKATRSGWSTVKSSAGLFGPSAPSTNSKLSSSTTPAVSAPSAMSVPGGWGDFQDDDFVEQPAVNALVEKSASKHQTLAAISKDKAKVPSISAPTPKVVEKKTTPAVVTPPPAPAATSANKPVKKAVKGKGKGKGGKS